MSREWELRNCVGGRWLGTEAGARQELVDPSTAESLGSAPVTRWTDVDAAMGVAAEAFDGWARCTPARRQRMLLRWAELVESSAAELVAAECRNTGKRSVEVRDAELPLAMDLLRFYAGAVRCLEVASAGEYVPGHFSFARCEPIGVCAQVTSWTHPLLLAVAAIAPAVAAGNTVVFKPAETTPVSAALLVELAGEVFPPGVVNVICGDRDSGRAMVAHEVPGMVSMTGSVRSGMEIAGQAAADLKRAHLQLGGKAPVVVFADADVGRAARVIARAAWGNAGQSCTAASRVLAAESVYEELVGLLVEQAGLMRPGPPGDAGAAFGPLNSAGQRELVEAVLGRLPAHAEVVAGGSRVPGPGLFHEATVVVGLAQSDELVRQEVLGPVVTVQPFVDEDEAVELANGVRYGLVAGVWTREHARGVRMSQRLRAGTVWINAHHPLVAEMPHSGFKHSASGRDLGRHGLEDFVRVKHVMSALG